MYVYKYVCISPLLRANTPSYVSAFIVSACAHSGRHMLAALSCLNQLAAQLVVKLVVKLCVCFVRLRLQWTPRTFSCERT